MTQIHQDHPERDHFQATPNVESKGPFEESMVNPQDELKTHKGDQGEAASREGNQREAAAPVEEAKCPSPEATTLSAADYEKQIAALKQEVEDFRNRAMRWQAELENYQKRVSRQLAEERRYAAIELIRDLLPVYDNLQRAAQSAEQNHDVNHVLEGLRMILKQWEDVLGKHHCRKIEALHKPFDPNLHHAISRQATGDVPPNTVLYVAQEGFILHDRVVRPSQVIVSMELPAAGGEGVSETAPQSANGPSNNHPPG